MRMRRLGWALALVVLLWTATGIRRLDPDSEWGVVEVRPFGGLVRVSGGWALAPPGLCSFERYPTAGLELALPQAREAGLRNADGVQYGFRGRAGLLLNAQAWRDVHAAARGGGVRALLREAVREAAGGLPPGAETGIATAAIAQTFRQRLDAALSARGALLQRLDFDSIDFLTLGEDDLPPARKARVLWVGLDGADWEIIDPLIAQGRMPHLQSLIARGARAKLLTITPTLSPVVWTSMATGVPPGRHGILDFLIEDPDTGRGQPVTSAQRRAATVWEMLSRADVRVGVIGWWASWPAEPVRGYLLSDRIAYQLFGFQPDVEDAQGKTWPPELYADVRPQIRRGADVPWSAVQDYLAGSRRELEQFDDEERRMLEEFRTLLASGETYSDLADSLRERFDPELEIVYFEGTDTVGHLFMPYRPPERPGIDPRRLADFGEMVDRYYETADAFLGRLLEGRGDDWTVIVASDHGFASDATRPRLTDSRIGHGAAADWHRRFGMLVLSGRDIRAGANLGEASIYDVAPTVLALFGQPVPRSWPGRVLGEALQAEFLDAHPVALREEDPPRRLLLADLAQDDPAAAELVEKLMSLGYVASNEPGAARASSGNNAGVALLAEGKYAEAERAFRDALAATPNSPSVIVNLGIAIRNQGRREEARELFERAFAFTASRRVAGHLLAQMELRAGRPAEAERRLRLVLQAEPGAAEVWSTLGSVLEETGNTEGAADAYRRAAELDRNAALPRNGLGNLAKWSGDPVSAERWYREAIEADPFFMGAYNNLALVYQAQGRLGEAIDLYSRALAKAPLNAVVLNNLASLYHARGERDEAAKLWRRSTGADPSYPSPLSNLASLAIEDGEHAEAERLLLRALTIDPDYGDAHVNLGIVYRQTQRWDAARREFRRGGEDAKSRLPALTQLGFLELQLGRLGEAIAALEQARAAGARDSNVFNALGEAYRAIGDVEAAEEAWERSLALSDQPAVRRRLAELTSAPD